MGLDRTWELVEYGIEVRDRPLALAGAITGPAQKQQRADRIRCGIMCFLGKPQGVLVMGQTAQGTGVIAFNLQIVRSKLAGLFEIIPGQQKVFRVERKSPHGVQGTWVCWVQAVGVVITARCRRNLSPHLFASSQAEGDFEFPLLRVAQR